MGMITLRLPLPPSLRKEKGFTLTEVVVVTAIVAIISAIAIPYMNTLINNYRLNGATRLVWADLQNAKITAIKENRSIRVDFDFLARSYTLTRVDTAGIVFTRNLNPDYPTITASKTGGGGITFTSTGATSNINETHTVIVQGPMGSKSIEIKGTGRITIIWI
jgi:prepilin-type N-terminal cleavage/methylation domain-containing protein